jgi:SAM-dependent methyltransferase
MKTKLVKTGMKATNAILGGLNFKLTRTWEQSSDSFGDFIPWRETIIEAKKAGLSVADYIDVRYNTKGATDKAVQQLAALGLFEGTIDRVCEIGPGSGRYLEKILNICKPSYYEIYETAPDWRRWLAHNYEITAHVPNGLTLANTPSASIDFVHANKVFAGLPVLGILRYFMEMFRIVRSPGIIVFDLFTEDSFEGEKMQAWLDSGINYPRSMIARQFVIDYFVRNGCTFRGGFPVPMRPGTTEVFAFSK